MSSSEGISIWEKQAHGRTLIALVKGMDRDDAVDEDGSSKQAGGKDS